MARVLALTGEMDGCTLWRVLTPFSELQRQGFPMVEWGPHDDERLANIVHKFEAVILPRRHWAIEERAKGERWIDALHRAGIAVIFEADDDLFSDDFVRRIMWKELYTREYAEERREALIYTLRLADGATVSSQRLATMAREYTDRPIKVVPNYIDLRWFKQVQKKAQRTVNGLTIGWAGSFRPDTDLEMMATAWGRVAEKYPRVRFVLQGRDLDIIYQSVPAERITQLPWMPIESYPAGLVNTDIGCCSLAETKFNRAKTFIKAMEYAASGAAVVASPTVYDKIVDHGINGFIASTADEWTEYLSMLVEDYTLRHDMSKALLAKVRKYHSLEANAWRWIEAWDEIIGDFRFRQQHRVLIPKGVRYAHQLA